MNITISIILGFAVMGVVILCGWLLGIRALFTIFGILAVMGLFIFGMLYAYWYLFKKHGGG